MPKKPTILSSRKIAHSRLFIIEQLHLRFENGQERIFERILGRSKGSVMVIPMLDDQTVLLVREYGAAMNDYYLAFPKGVIDSNETPEQAANRELKEEVGYGANKLTRLKPMSSSPGYFGKPMLLLLAQDLYRESLPGDEPEQIEVVPWRLDNLDELMARDEFCESRSIAAILMIREKFNVKEKPKLS